MDRLEAMRVFRAVVDGGSLSAASRQLRMPLATVSRKVSDLEAHLKARLLQRSTRKLVLTDAGADYLAACRRILDEVDDAERRAAGEFTAPRGDLVITAPVLFGRLHVLPIVADFLRAYPEVDVRLLLGDRVLNLLDEHVDVAVRIGELADSALVATRVGATRQVVSGSPAYLDQRGRPAQLGELSTHDTITFEGLMGAQAWTFREGTAVSVRSRLTVNTAEAAIAAAISGVGLTRTLSYQVSAPMREKTLERVLQDFEPPPSPISLVYPQQGRLPLKTRAFLDFATPRLRAGLVGSS